MDAMIDICNEVANGKIAEPYIQQNSSLEESPFASNSIIDFTNNIKSVQNMYLGKYTNDGKGLEDLIKAIMWHSGEAENAKNEFKNSPKAYRDALIKFLNSL
jgi:hypothetical protein